MRSLRSLWKYLFCGWWSVPILIWAGCMQKKELPLQLVGTWRFAIDSLDHGLAEEWFKAGIDRSGWREIDLPDFWDRYNLASYDGVGWYARTFEVHDTAAPMTLYFGGVDDDADVWINGEKVGSHAGYADAFFFDVTPFLRSGVNELVVRVVDKGGPGGIYKPITLIRSDRIEDLLRSRYSLLDARRSADWVSDAVIYEVSLRSFSRQGTFKGLEARLPELNRLGVTVVWLMPIHPVGELNRKGTLGSPYAVQDYYGINPEFGTLDDFRSLVRAVHRNGMHIIIDLVANHTAWDSRLMMEHPEWFTHNAEGAIVSPNPDWTDVADLDYNKHELWKYMIHMMKYWVKEEGIDGFRCDVAELVPTEFWETARQELDAIRPVMMLAEGTLPEHHIKAFDLTYSWNVYDVLDKVINGSTPASVLDDILKTETYQFPRGSLRLRFNTNHDKNAWDAPAVEKFTPAGAKATAVLIFTMPGVPMVYNGEEVGNPKPLRLFEKVDIDWSKHDDFRELYESLGRLRKQHPSLRNLSLMRIANTGGPKVYSFLRSSGQDTVLVVINFSRESLTAVLNNVLSDGRTWKQALGETHAHPVGSGLSVRLPGFGYGVFIH